MGYDEFEKKLRAVKEDFRESEGKYPTTVEQIEEFLRARKLGRQKKGRPTLKSLRGLGF